MSIPAVPVTIALDGPENVSGLFQLPADARACLVLAHGAGAGMQHPFMAAIATELAAHGIATLRYQFPYMERKSKRVDAPRICHATVRAAVAEAARLVPAMPLVAGGKSFGGRMTSQAQAAAPIPGVRGLVFLGFPLHPPKAPADQRGRHLLEINIPMFFAQGTRDTFAEPQLLNPLIERLETRATLKIVDGADHSFHVPARSGRTDAAVRQELVQALAEWIALQAA